MDYELNDQKMKELETIIGDILPDHGIKQTGVGSSLQLIILSSFDLPDG